MSPEGTLKIIDRKKVLYSTYLNTGGSLPKGGPKATYHKPIALGASAVSFLVGLGFQVQSQLIRNNYEKNQDSAYIAMNAGYLEPADITELQRLRESHVSSYRSSIIGFGGASILLGASFFLEW